MTSVEKEVVAVKPKRKSPSHKIYKNKQEKQKHDNRTLKGRYRSLTFGAKQRQKQNNITLKTYSCLISNPCFYCGGSLNETGYGLDLLDPLGEYVSENCVACCRVCNIAKNKRTLEEFKSWITTVYLNITKGGSCGI